MSSDYVPDRYRAPCALCGIELDTRANGVHQWVRGWVMNREGGGGHAVSLPERENKWAHRHCVERATKGTFGQQPMF